MNELTDITWSNHRWYAIDLMEEKQADYIAYKLKDEKIDIVVHNVGGTLELRDPLAKAEDWARVWQFNVGHAIDMNHYLIPSMQARGWGRVIHVSSISAVRGRGCAAYCSAKAFLNSYVETVGRAIAPSGVVMSAVMPGVIYAEGGHWDAKAEKNLKDPIEFERKKADFLKHHQAVGRLGLANEIAPWVCMLASDYATFAQGCVLPIDGGTQ